MKMTHENVEYELDIQKAIKAGFLKVSLPEASRLQAGDIFRCSREGAINNFLLVQCTYKNYLDQNPLQFQLLGMGCSPNSGNFYAKTHTIEEIHEYLVKCSMYHCGNINSRVANLTSQI